MQQKTAVKARELILQRTAVNEAVVQARRASCQSKREQRLMLRWTAVQCPCREVQLPGDRGQLSMDKETSF
jgi:hypothetical protein